MIRGGAILRNLSLIFNTQEAGVIYWSKFGLAGTSLKFWGMVDTYMESLYTKFQVNRSEGSSWSVEVKFWLILHSKIMIFGHFQVQF